MYWDDLEKGLNRADIDIIADDQITGKLRVTKLRYEFK